MAERDRPLTFGRPHPPDDRLQPDAVLVGGPDLDQLVRVLSSRLSDGLLQLFLNASRSSGVAEAGWRGRGFCTDQPTAFRASQPRWGKTAASPSSLAIQRATFGPVHKATIRRRLTQTSLELVQQVRPQDRGAGAVAAPQITQSLGTVGGIASPQTLTWGAILSI